VNPAADQVFDQPFEAFLIQAKLFIEGCHHGGNDTAERARQLLVQAGPLRNK
jgi:hypothetical protein